MKFPNEMALYIQNVQKLMEKPHKPQWNIVRQYLFIFLY